MESRAKILGHPAHQMLVPFPLGMLAGAVVADVVSFWSESTLWGEMAYWLIAWGVVLGAVAAVFGWIDWLAIPAGTRAKRIGLLHGSGNAIVLALFAISWLLRRDIPSAPPTFAYVTSFAAFALAGVTAWLGGELVSRLAVGVTPGAGLDAPNSLRESASVRP